MALIIRESGEAWEVYGTKTGKVWLTGTKEQCQNHIRNRKATIRRRAIASAMDSIGMVKVRGAMGGTYWE